MTDKRPIKVPEHAYGGRVNKSGSNQSFVGDVSVTVNSLGALAKDITENITDDELKELLPEEFEKKHRLFRLTIPHVIQIELSLNVRSRPLDVARLYMPWTQMYEVNFEEEEEEDEGWVDVKVTEAANISDNVNIKESEVVDVKGVEKKAKEQVKQKLKQNLMKLQEPVGADEKVDLSMFEKLIDEW